MEIKLKPCPFCGGEAELKINHCASYVECKECEASTDHILDSPMYCAKDKAIEAWNRRTEKHGYWSECYTDSHHYSGICSVCGGGAIRKVKGKPLDYCPKCGARMDGDPDV